MDDYKRKSIKDYTSWDANCIYIKNKKWQRKMKKKLRRITRKRIKKDMGEF
jgi:hypothetical protein